MSAPLIRGYELGAEIGRGGMGTVFRARAASGEDVAIKVVRDTSSDEERQRFLREARIRLDHPNVARTLGAGLTSSGDPYLVLELLLGESLDARIERGPLPVAEVVRIAIEVCRGLEAAHAAGIVHRDIKPANVFVCATGETKVLDFGVAHTAGGTSVTRTGQVLGTPAYLSPEQARGSNVVGPSTDVWAMGVLLYRCLSGRTPFDRPTPLATALSVLVDEPQPLGTLALGVPRDLANVVHRCLEKRATERYADAAALRVALEAARVEQGDGALAPLRTALDGAEARVVSLVLATGVRDEAIVLARFREAGAITLALPASAFVGVLGVPRTEGGELDRAALAAGGVLGVARSVAVVSGRVGGAGHPSVELLARAQALAERAGHGIVLDDASARALGVPSGDAAGSGVRWTPDDSAVRDVVPWVNRHEELREIGSAAARSLDLDGSRAGAIVVTGPPGIGKSALIERSLEALREARPSISIARARAGLTRSPDAFATLAAALRSVGVELDVTAAHGPGGADRRRVACFDALGDLVARGALVVVIDDAEGADAASLDLLCDLVGQLEHEPLCLVLASAEESDGIRAVAALPGGVARSLRLGPLEERHTRELVDRTLGTSSPAAATITERAQGVPLFAVELARAVKDGRLEPDGDVPLGVESAIQVVLDRLLPGELATLRVLAILRRAVSVADVAAMGIEDAERTVSALVRRGLVASVREGGRTRRHHVRHPLVQRVAREQIAAARRTELHARAAVLLATFPEPDREEIAYHRAEAGERERAATLYADVASGAARDGDAHTALRCATLAITLGPPKDRAFDVHLARADAALFLGLVDERESALHAALAAAPGDAARARALTELAELRLRQGRSEVAFDLAREAVALAKNADDADALVRASGREAIVLASRDRAGEAERSLAVAMPVLDRASPQARGFFADARAWTASRRGDYGVCLAAYREAAARYAEAGDLRRATGVQQNLADVWNRLGRHDEAERALVAALPICHKLGNRLTETYALLNLAYATVRLGRETEALEALTKVRALLARAPNAHADAHERLYRARAEAALDPRSEQALGIAVDVGRGDDLPELRATALALAATVHLERDELVRANELAVEALARIASSDAIVEDEAEVFVTAERIATRLGDVARARAIAHAGADRLVRTAARIGDADVRHAFSTQVPAHAALARFVPPSPSGEP